MKTITFSLFNIKYVALIVAVTGLLLSLVYMSPSVHASGPTDAGVGCLDLDRTLSLGSSDSDRKDDFNDVSRLQTFLAQDPPIYPEALVTGYFGTITEKAVQRWQSANNVVTSGSAKTSGYGVVGPKTRKALELGCDGDGGATESSIRVSSPNGGEEWEIGTTNTITWTPYGYNPDVNPSFKVTAYLEKKVRGKFVTVGKVIENGKASIHWRGEIGAYSNYAEAGQYYIRVVNNETGKSDRSDKSFTLVEGSSSLYVEHPNLSDDTITIGEENLIHWAHTDIDLMSIALYADDKWLMWIEKDMGPAEISGGEYVWTPEAGGVADLNAYRDNVFKIYISGRKTGGLGYIDDKSNETFGFNNATPNVISVTAPNGGEVWDIGKVNTITWAPYGYNPEINPSSDVTAYLTKKVSGEFVTVGKVVASGKASIHWLGELDYLGNYANPGEYYIKVVNTKTGSVDYSDVPFVLIDPAPIDMQVEFIDSDAVTHEHETDESRDYGEFILEFDVTAIGDDIYIPVGDYPNAPNSGLSYETFDSSGQELSNSGEYLDSGTMSFTSTADQGGGVYQVREGETESFTLTVIVDPVDAGMYQVRLDRIGYNFDGGSNPTNHYEAHGSDIETEYLYIDGTGVPRNGSGGGGTSTSTELGTYIGYANGDQFIRTENISRQDAYENCVINATSNPDIIVYCTWNGDVIFSSSNTTGGSSAFNVGSMPKVAGASITYYEAQIAGVLQSLQNILNNLR